MSSRSNLLSRFLLVVLLVAAIATVIVKQNEVSSVRFEHQSLSSASSKQQQLARENQDLPQLRADAKEIQKLREENRDLPKLRNDVLQLRRQAEEMEKIRSDNVRLAGELAKPGSAKSWGNPPPDFVSRTSLVDAGLGSPEATVQTAFWAIVRGDTNRVSECFLNPGQQENRNNVETMQNEAAALVGYRIADKQTRARGVSIFIETYPAGVVDSVDLTQVDGEWKIGGNLYGK